MKFIAFIKYITLLFVFLLSVASSERAEAIDTKENSFIVSPSQTVLSIETTSENSADVTSENSVFEKEFIPYRDYDGSIGEYFLGEELIFSIKALFIDDVAEIGRAHV